jgi:hypothetical protein
MLNHAGHHLLRDDSKISLQLQLTNCSEIISPRTPFIMAPSLPRTLLALFCACLPAVCVRVCAALVLNVATAERERETEQFASGEIQKLCEINFRAAFLFVQFMDSAETDAKCALVVTHFCQSIAMINIKMLQSNKK